VKVCSDNKYLPVTRFVIAQQPYGLVAVVAQVDAIEHLIAGQLLLPAIRLLQTNWLLYSLLHSGGLLLRIYHRRGDISQGGG
jgi:hypothetical protein